LRIKELAICFLVLLLPASHGYAQSRMVRKAISSQDKKAEQQEEDYQKKRKAVLRHRFDIQTKEVQKRMKLAKKKSRQYNKSREEKPFSNLFDNKRKKHR